MRHRLDYVLISCVPSRHCTSASRNGPCAPARAQCLKRPGPGACTGTSPISGGMSKLRELATGLGATSSTEAPDSSTIPSTIARAKRPWNFLKGACGARPKGDCDPWEREIVRGIPRGPARSKRG